MKDKYKQPKPCKMPPTYDGMGKDDPYPTFSKPRPTNPKTGTVRGRGAATKGAYMSKNG